MMDSEEVSPLDSVEFRRAHREAKQRLFPGSEPRLQIEGRVLLKRIGSGARGVVYLAYDPELDRKVAIKWIVAAGDAVQSAYEEARALAKVAHPNVARVFSVGKANDGVHLEMEFVEGVTLDRWLETRPSAATIVQTFMAVGSGLAAVHAAGLVHGDFKPRNVMVSHERTPYLVDFGLASATASARGGTPAYMAPEQRRGEVSPASDQYAFCVALAQALARADAPGRGRVRGPFGRVLERGAAVEPSRRYPSMVELFAALDRARSRRRVGGVAATATIVAGSLAAWVLRGGPEQSACVDGETEMAAVWSPAVEADLQRRLQIGPRGPALRPSAAIEALEGHFAAWETAWNDTCGEETVRSEAQRECLRQMLMDARGTLAALSTIQPEELPLALDAIAGLEGVDRCTARVPQSIEPHPAADTALASARTLFRLGRFDAARDELVAADDLVDVPDSKRARLLLLTARIDTYPPDTPVPQGRIVEAAGLARRGSDGALEAEIWLFRAALASHRGEVDVDPWLALADVALGASRPTPWFVAERASVVGMAAAAREEYPAAALALRKAVATARAAWGDDDSRTAGYLDNLGIVLRQAGNVREARPAHEQALRVRERALGPLHPAVGRSLMNLAAMDRELGEHEAALHRFARVFEIARFAGGEQNPSMALVLWARADALTALQRDAEALADLRTAYELHREAFGPCDEQTRRARDRWSVKVASLGRDDVGEDPVCPG